MSDLIEFIRNYWKSNEVGNSKPYETLQGLTPEFAANIFIGYSDLGNRCLFLKIENLTMPPAQNEKTNISLIVNRQNSLVYIELNDIYFDEIFNDLIVSIVSKLKNVPQEKNLAAFIALYNKWNELFRSQLKKSDLTVNELLGLIGELTFLQTKIDIAADSVEVNAVLDAWSGPEGKANDFIFTEIAFEVKTIEGHKDYINISSEYQLSCINRPVHLVVYRASFDQQGTSLVDLVTSVRTKTDIKLGDTERFLFKLNRFNLDFRNTAVYSDFKVILSGPEYYNTDDDDFPKITAEHLQEGVFGLKYKLNINSLLKHRM